MKRILSLIVILFVSTNSFALTDNEFKEITKKAEHFDAESQQKLAEHYFSQCSLFNTLEEISNTGNYGDGMKWMLRAAYQGLPSAQLALARKYANRSGKISKEEALYWAMKASQQNYANAFTYLGNYYMANDYKEEAIEWYKKYMDCVYNTEGYIDKYVQKDLAKLGVENYTPKEDSYWTAVRYESDYTIGGKTRNEWDTIKDSKEPAFTIHIKFYDNKIEVDGQELIYYRTYKGYKVYSEKRGLFSSYSGIYYLVDENYNVVYEDLTDSFILGTSRIWTDARKGKVEDFSIEDFQQIENKMFFESPLRIGSFYYDLDYVTTVTSFNNEESGLSSNASIFRSVTNPKYYFFSFYNTKSGINYEQSLRFFIEENNDEEQAYLYQVNDTMRELYFHFRSDEKMNM